MLTISHDKVKISHEKVKIAHEKVNNIISHEKVNNKISYKIELLKKTRVDASIKC